MTKILIASTGADDWRRFLADPEKQWKRGFSAMAAALSWETADGLPREIAALIGNSPELLLAIPEHKVQLPAKGHPSQCDVFALVRCEEKIWSVAVEAKVAEPFGSTVDEWLAHASVGKHKRLEGLCRILNTPYPPPGRLRYQLFHRTAAAILEADRFNADFAAMFVQSFSPSARWYDDFADFCKLFGTAPLKNLTLKTELPSGKTLALGWATGSQEFI